MLKNTSVLQNLIKMDEMFDIDNNLLCSENFGYHDELYNSPAYSDDSGFSGQNFSLESLLDDVLPPVINDVEFGKIRDFSRSDSVSSSNHDHSYSLLEKEETFEHFVSHTPVTVASSTTAAGGKKRKLNESEFLSDKIMTATKIMKKETIDSSEKSLKPEATAETELNIDIIQCDDKKFSYRDENGKVVVVDKSRKNAEMAKLNRQRKKRYISKLESEVKELKGQNSKLSQVKSKQELRIENLENEVEYLMSVIRNQTMLSSVLKAVSNAPGVPLNTSCKPKYSDRLPGKRILSEESDENEKFSGGVCVHVSENKVSLEFCSSCNQKQ